MTTIDPAEQLVTLVKSILNGIATAQMTPEEIAAGGGNFSATQALDALAYATAMLIEASPSAETTKGLRTDSDAQVERFRHYLRTHRRDYERTGTHTFEQFGGFVAAGATQ